MAFEASFSSVAAPEPAAAPLPLCQEGPVPGTFMFLPRGAPWEDESLKTPGGDPTGHPVLILPSEDLEPPFVRVVFATTKDIVGYTNSRKWACNYLPLEGQSHPWRDAIPLAQGCVAFPKPSSINVSSKYVVAWTVLEDVNFTSPGMLAPCLSAEALVRLVEYVKFSEADMKAPWKIVPPKVQARIMAMAMGATASRPAPVPVAAPVTTMAPVAALLPFRLADGTPFNPWLLAGNIVARSQKPQPRWMCTLTYLPKQNFSPAP
ncbi:hypothetical protein KCU73_g9467, partial [Aureobasidium melanogenum]